MEVIKIPFGPYKNFQDCVNKNRDKGNPKAYCAALHKKITGKWPTELSEEEIKKMEQELERGEGRGVGGPRQGLGPAKYCKCTKCGNKVEHVPNCPCADYSCPKCGGDLVGLD